MPCMEFLASCLEYSSLNIFPHYIVAFAIKFLQYEMNALKKSLHYSVKKNFKSFKYS